MKKHQPNLPEPIAVGAVSFAFTVHATSRRWLSFGRLNACMRSQVHIRNFTGALDWGQIEQVLVSAAAHFGMADTTITSRVPQTIRCFSQRVGYGFAIGARVFGNLVIVDFNPGKKPSEHFSPIVERITSELQRIFTERYYVPQQGEFIEPQHTLPVSDEAREFARRHFRDEGSDA
jgi:hypothetical protein